jgi:hypothetical protein
MPVKPLRRTAQGGYVYFDDISYKPRYAPLRNAPTGKFQAVTDSSKIPSQGAKGATRLRLFPCWQYFLRQSHLGAFMASQKKAKSINQN